MTQTDYPLFISEHRRDLYLDKLIQRGNRIKAKTVYIEGTPISKLNIVDGRKDWAGTFTGMLFTVEDVDKRKGK